jgi:hypothetical protein
MIGNLVFSDHRTSNWGWLAIHAVYEHRQSKRQWIVYATRDFKFTTRISYIYNNLEPVVQSPISANPGLNFNLLFLFMYFCMMICNFKTLENKTSIEPEKISGKT